jgi:serine/threonine-protein kinase RsbW
MPLREALANAIIHAIARILENPSMLNCRRGPDEVSIAVKDEGKGFDIANVPDPRAPEDIRSLPGRGIHIIKALINEVRFEEGRAVIHMRNSVGEAPKLGEPSHEPRTPS